MAQQPRVWSCACRVMRLIAHGSSNLRVLGSCVSRALDRPWFQQPYGLWSCAIGWSLHVFQRNLRVLGHVVSQRPIASDLAQPAGSTASLVMRLDAHIPVQPRVLGHASVMRRTLMVPATFRVLVASIVMRQMLRFQAQNLGSLSCVVSHASTLMVPAP
jgi:hypothetical protein